MYLQIGLQDGVWEFALELGEVIVNSIIEVYHTIGLQGWLIILTLIVTVASYRSQKRAGIREAIEQLDPRYTSYTVFNSRRHKRRHVQIKAGLNSFNLIWRQCKISLISNRITDRSDRVVMHSVPPYYLTIPEKQTERYRKLEDRILDHELIEDVDREETQLVVTCSTINPVECRQVANYVLNEHDHSERNQVHRHDFRPWPDP